nr:hypothetical protein [Tanacetum cinerariifolium]
KEAAKFVEDFKSLTKEAVESLAKHKALELETEHLLRAVVSQDIISVAQNNSVVDTSNLQTKLERMKERFENCIIKKENEYAKLWNDRNKKYEACKFDKISYDKAYKDTQQKIERLQAQLEDLKGRKFQVLNYAKENAHLKITYKNMFDSISVSRTQTKTIIASLQNKLHNTLYENAKLRAQLFNKVSVQKGNTRGTSANTKFAKQSIMKNLPKVGKTHALSKPVTSNSISTPQESQVVQNDKVIAPGMFRINPFKPSREQKHVPNNVRTKPITVSQPPVITKKVVNSDSNGLHSTGVDNTKTRRPQIRSNTKNDRKQKENVSIKEKQKKQQPKVKKTKKVGFIERLATPKPSKHRFFLRWSPTGRLFDLKGKIIISSESESQSDCSNGDNACCSKHITRNLKLLINFVWKFMRTVHFGNDHVAAILGFGDLQWGNILIIMVYFIERLGYSLFSVGQFCDSNLEVAFRRNTCFVRNLEGVDLLKGNCTTNLYTINLHDIASASPICLMARTSSTKSWLWHQRLSHLNFETINYLAKNDLVSVPNSRQRLHLLHMDLCGPMRIASINGKRTKNYTEFKNQVLKEYFDSFSISYQVSFVRTPQQNGVVEHRNRTLVEAARTMLIFSQALLFLWAEAIATACFTQNRSIIHHRFNKTPYDLINGRKPNISFHHVFEALCYPKNDREDIGKLGVKGDIGFFIGYSADSCAYRVYNRRTKKIMETMNVSFDELLAMAFEQHSLKPELQSMTSGQVSSGLDLTYASSTITSQQSYEGELDLRFKAMYDDFIGGQPLAAHRTVSAAQAQQQQGNWAHLQSKTVADDVPNAMFDGNTFVNPFANQYISAAESLSSQNVDTSNMHTFYQPYPHEFQWTKDYPFEQVIGEPSRPVLTRNQL